MRRLLIPALLVNLVSLPAMAQEVKERPARDDRATPAGQRDSAVVGWERPAPSQPHSRPNPQPGVSNAPYAPPSGWENRRDRDDAHPWPRRNEDRSWRDKNWSDRDDREEGERQRGWRNRDARDNWTRDWHDDRRFDWRRHRDTHRPFYRMPHYRLPYGYSYGYRRIVIGLFLDPVFYSPLYWINDPWSYRLPPAQGSFRWVRYFDDVVLIDLRNGRVIDVVYDFFW